jgi:tRNA-modifying protein YgfZ
MPTAVDIGLSYKLAHEQAVFFDLSLYGKIELRGPDAVVFLHNLCTNDIKSLADGASCEAFLCTAKGKTSAHFLVQRTKDRLLLVMVPGLAEKVVQTLNKYLISEQVEITDRTAELAQLRVVGPQAGEVIDLETLGEPVLPHRLLGLPGFDLFCSTAKLKYLIEELGADDAEPAPPELHEILRVEAGTPEYGKDIDDERFVMEIGRTAQAICYTKGCFLGQEPIVMARDRGHVNRVLMGVKVQPAAGSESKQDVVAAGSKLMQGDAEAGTITSSVWSPGLNQVIGLAYLKRGNQEPGMVLTIEPARDGRQALVTSLPFVS